MQNRSFPKCCLLLSFLLASWTIPGRLVAEDGKSEMPAAPQLLPEETLFFVRVSDADTMRVQFADSSLGQMLGDPKLRPLATDVYEFGSELFERVGQEMGISLDQLLEIPSGQIAFAVLPLEPAEDEGSADSDAPKDESPEAIRERIEQKRRQRNGFSAVAMVNAGEKVGSLRTIVEHLADKIVAAGFVRREDRVGSTRLVRLVPQREGRQPVEFFERDGSFVFGIGDGVARRVLQRWSEKIDSPTLAESPNFAAVMGPSLGAESALPQVTLFVDPYRIAKRLVNRSGAAGFIWPIFEDLGVDKFRGVGGSVFQGGEFFADLTHLHVLIEPPRDGFFGVIRPSTGDTQPPQWVPGDASGYTTLHWDFETTVKNFAKVVDKFAGEGTFERNVADDIKQKMGIDLREELLPTLSGRYVSVRWLEPTAKFNSQTQAWALELTDPAKAKDLLDRARQKRTNLFVPEVIGGRMVYFFERRRSNLPEAMRQPEPAIFLLDNWFIAADSRTLIERLIRANGGSISQLAKDPDYQLVSSELGIKLGGEDPFLVSFIRSADMIRQFYDLAKSPETRRLLRGASERNPVLAKLYQMLERNELPPFETFRKYFAPTGMFAYDQPNGIHFGSFTLRPLE